MTDHREIGEGSKTTQGTVKYIYGARQDWIVFLNQDDELKTFGDRSDDVFRLAVREAHACSAEAFQKLDKAHLNDVIDHLATCLVRALQPGVGGEEVPACFRPVRTFVGGLEGTKLVLARGPNPQHLVYVTESNRVAWQARQLPPHAKGALGDLDRLKQNCALLPKRLRLPVALAIGNAASTAFRSDPVDNLHPLVVQASDVVRSHLGQFNHMVFSATVMAVSLVTSAAIFLSGAAGEFYGLAALGGIGGAVVSAISRKSLQSQSLFLSVPWVVTQGIFRVALGALAGLLGVAAVDAGLRPDRFNDSLASVFVTGIAAGFAERFVPDALTGLADSKLIAGPE